MVDGALGIVAVAGPICGEGPRGPMPAAPTPGGMLDMPGLSPLPVPTAVTRACVS